MWARSHFVDPVRTLWPATVSGRRVRPVDEPRDASIDRPTKGLRRRRTSGILDLIGCATAQYVVSSVEPKVVDSTASPMYMPRKELMVRLLPIKSKAAAQPSRAAAAIEDEGRNAGGQDSGSNGGRKQRGWQLAILTAIVNLSFMRNI
jgi:hypothetical protein